MFAYSYTVKFSDCDPAGLLYFANIFPICHGALEEMLLSFNLAGQYFKNEEIIFPLITVNAKYFKQIKLHSEIWVEVSIKEMRKSSFAVFYNIMGSDGEKLAEAETVHVSVSKTSGTKTDLPEFIIKAFTSEGN